MTESKPTESSRTLEDNYREERETLQALEELSTERRKLREFEEDAQNMQGESLQRISQLRGPLTSARDAAMQEDMLTRHREIAYAIQAQIDDHFDQLKTQEKTLQERLNTLFYERQRLVQQTDTDPARKE